MKRSLNHTLLYRRTIVFIAVCLFFSFTLVYIAASLLVDRNSSSWLSITKNFIQNLYPNVVLVFATFCFSLLVYRPIQESEMEIEEEKMIPRFYELAMQANSSVKSIAGSGLIGIQEDITTEQLGHKIQGSKSRVFILENWICQNLYQFEFDFHKAALNGSQIQILLLNPESIFATQRSRDLGAEANNDLYVPDRIKANIAAIKKIHSKWRLDNLEVRLHSTLPSIQSFIFDNQAFVGLFLHGVESHAGLQFQIQMRDENQTNTQLGKYIEDEFTKVWENATPISLKEG